jgi:hypothetical protein
MRGRPRRPCARRAARRPSRNGWRDPPGLPPLTYALRTRDHLPMPGHFPSVGLDRTLSDGDGVADLAATVGGPLAQRTPYRTIAAQTVKHAGVKHFPRRHIHITVDRLVRDPHRRGTGMLPPQPLGDLLRRPVVVKFGGDHTRQLRIGGQLAHFRTPRPLGRSSIGSQRRYASRPPLPTISRDTVDDGRPMRPAIDRAVRPAAIPREISSRSTKLR